MMMMAVAKVGLDGAFIRPVEEPYYTASSGWGSPVAQPWWADYNLDNATPTSSSNTQNTTLSSSLMGNVLQQGWSAMVSPRKAQEPNEAATAITTPTGEFAENPLDKKTPPPTASKPTENRQTVPTAPAIPTVAQQAPVVASLPLNPATTLLPSVQPNPLLSTTQPLNSLQPQPLLTPPPIGGVPITMTPPNPLSQQNALPATENPIQTILAQLAMLKLFNEQLARMLTKQSEQLTKLTANNACGCASGGGTCGCTTKPETASKSTTETKLAQSKEKTADKTNKNKVS